MGRPLRSCVTDGRALLAAAMAQMRRWGVTAVGAECALPAPGCYGIPDTMPHLRALLTEAGFGEPTRREFVLAARCDDLLGADLGGATIVRTVGTLGARFTLSVDDDAPGYIEVCQPSADLARSSVATHWADAAT